VLPRDCFVAALLAMTTFRACRHCERSEAISSPPPRKTARKEG
jgi:hypothetical protein